MCSPTTPRYENVGIVGTAWANVQDMVDAIVESKGEILHRHDAHMQWFAEVLVKTRARAVAEYGRCVKLHTSTSCQYTSS